MADSSMIPTIEIASWEDLHQYAATSGRDRWVFRGQKAELAIDHAALRLSNQTPSYFAVKKWPRKWLHRTDGRRPTVTKRLIRRLRRSIWRTTLPAR